MIGWPTPPPQEAFHMNAASKGTHGRTRLNRVLDYTPFSNTSNDAGWWRSPPRRGIHRVIAPWEYRHLRFYGIGRIAGGAVATAAGLICLLYTAYPWAALFLVLGALNLAGGSWF